MKILSLGIEKPSFFEEAEVFHFPVIEIFPLEFSLNAEEIKSFTHVILTSPRAVSLLAQGMAKQGLSKELFLGKTFLAVGPSTAEEVQMLWGVSSEYPEEFCQEGVLKLLENLPFNSRVFFPKAKVTRSLIEDFLTKKNVPCYSLAVYETRLKMHKRLPDLTNIEAIYFSSPSTVRGFLANFGKIPEEKQLLVSGAVTRAALEVEAGKDRNYIERQGVSI